MGSLHRARHRGPQKIPGVFGHYRESGRNEEEKWFFDPFVPDIVRFSKDLNAVPWEGIPTEVIKREQQCWNFDPKSK